MKSIRKRRAVAPLEVVMILPIWVLMLCLIIYIGAGGIEALTVVNETHWDTWKQRDYEVPENVRPMALVGVQGKLHAENKAEVKGRSIFDKWDHVVENTQSIYVDSWDGDVFTRTGASASSESAKVYRDQIKGQMRRNSSTSLPQMSNDNPRINVPVGKSSEADD